MQTTGGKKRKANSSASDGVGNAAKRAKNSDSGIDDSDNSAVNAAAASKSFVQKTPVGQRIKNEPFRRVKSEEVFIKKRELRDNSYQDFDTWGNKANQDLIVTKGKSFRYTRLNLT